MEVHAVKTWYDRRRGVVTVADDVLGVVRDIKAISDRLTVYYNDQSNGFDVVERCLDGTDRLVLSADELDARVVNRLRAADHWYGRDDPDHVRPDEEDYLTELESDNAALEARMAEGHREKIGDVGERIAHALDLPLKGATRNKKNIFVKESPFVPHDSQ